jgi:serine/threonine protein kinase
MDFGDFKLYIIYLFNYIIKKLTSSCLIANKQRQKNKINLFEIISVIGKGVYGQVYKVIEKKSSDVYAIKQIEIQSKL